MVAAFLLVVGYVIFITIENTTLTGRTNRLLKELRISEDKNRRLVEPLESISKQEPLAALKMLRSLVSHNK